MRPICTGGKGGAHLSTISCGSPSSATPRRSTWPSTRAEVTKPHVGRAHVSAGNVALPREAARGALTRLVSTPGVLLFGVHPCLTSYMSARALFSGSRAARSAAAPLAGSSAGGFGLPLPEPSRTFSGSLTLLSPSRALSASLALLSPSWWRNGSSSQRQLPPGSKEARTIGHAALPAAAAAAMARSKVVRVRGLGTAGVGKGLCALCGAGTSPPLSGSRGVGLGAGHLHRDARDADALQTQMPRDNSR